MLVVMRSYFFTIIIFCFFSSCSVFIEGYSEYQSAKKYYKNANYDQAAFLASKSIKNNFQKKSVIELFENAFIKSRHNYKLKILDIESENNINWPNLYFQYSGLQNLNNELKSLVSFLNNNANYSIDLVPLDYSQKLDSIAFLAADFKYLEGLEYRKSSDKDSQKFAAKSFKAVQDFVPGYKNSITLYEETRKAAIITLLVSRFDGDRNIVNYLREQIINSQNDYSKEFLQLVTRDQLGSIINERNLVDSGITENKYLKVATLSGANHIMSASLNIVHRPAETILNENIKQEKEITVGKETYLDENGVEKTRKKKEKVTAKVKHYKKSAKSILTFSYKIIDINDSKILFSDNVKEKEKFFHEWATYEGDKRALNSKYNALIKAKDRFAPSRSELNMKAAKRIPKIVIEKLSDHYN